MLKFLKHLPRLIGLTTVLLPITLIANPALALMDQLGVVKNSYNSRQWAEITSRLNLMNIDYCSLDAQEFQNQSDLNNVSVLLLPNIENITGAQAQAL